MLAKMSLVLEGHTSVRITVRAEHVSVCEKACPSIDVTAANGLEAQRLDSVEKLLPRLKLIDIRRRRIGEGRIRGGLIFIWTRRSLRHSGRDLASKSPHRQPMARVHQGAARLCGPGTSSTRSWDRIDSGHFSVLNELVVHLWGRLEHAGRTMADRAPDGTENRPDVSVGKCFSDWLKKHHPNISTAFSYYIHKTPEWEGEARQYPFSALPLFREYLDTVWIPERAPDYLKTRDPAALPYLQKLLPSPNKPRAGMIKSRMIRRKAG